MIRTAIIGATGFTGSELIRLLHNHPSFDITAISSESKAGKFIHEVHPAFTGMIDLKLCKAEELKVEELDLIFFALPHGISMDFAARFSAFKGKIVDFSGDFRLDGPQTYEAWYGKEHTYEEGFHKAVYGLPEIHREAIRKASFVANPGCYPTASILSLLPLAKEGLLNEASILIDAKSGTTGAGIKPKAGTHYTAINENFKAYGLKTHRHTIEIDEQLQAVANKGLKVQFTPHLLPLDRGILATTYVCGAKQKPADLGQLYRDFYAEHPFVHVQDTLPDLKSVRGTNLCRICVDFDHRTQNILVVSAIDNLVKGAAGQAIHNANLMFDLPEETGLSIYPIYP